MPPQEHQDRTQQANAPAAAPPAGGRLIEFDEFIDAKLRKTRSHVRSVDFATSVMLLAAGTLVYILLAAVFDHWIVTGGLGFWSRTAFLVVYLLAAGAYLTMTLVPLLVRSINPLYAAETIERSQPSLKNGLVNFLFFRDRPERLNPAIYQAVEEQAARNLAGASSDAAVDRTTLIRVGYALAGILLVAAIYALVSPKNLFRTVGRIAVPWAEIDAPTRTTIGEIEPRDAQAFRGQQIEVSARIRDLPDDAPVRLIYTTADGQTVDRAIEMKPSDDGYKHVCLLPGGEATLQQDLQYRIEAGDAVTRPFRLDVVAAPTIFVESVETKYPAYTGLLAQRIERQGDVKAIEGSEVTIEAVANELIRAAHVDFDCDGTLDQRMSTSGDRAKVSFKLLLKDDRRTPKHASYQLIFTNERDQRNPQPVRHQIEVTRDVSPEIAFVAPTQDPFDVPANGSATLEIVANDPDFALALVKVSLMRGEKPLADKLLLSEPRRGQFVGKYRFEPKSLGLKPGDVVTYSALAEDNKTPNPNRAETAKKTLRVTAAGDRGQQDQVAQNDSAKNDQSRAGDPSQGERQQGQPDGNAPDKENADGQQGKQPPQNADQKSDGDQGGEQQSASKDAGNQASDRQPNDEQPGDKSQSQEKQPGQSQSQPGQEQRGAGEEQQGEDNSESQAGDQGGAGKQSKSSSSSGDKGNQQQGSQGESGGDSANQQETPVANDGSNDGDAIERILKHRDQQQPSGEKQAPQSSKFADSDNKQPDNPNADQARGGTQQSREGADQPPASPGDKNASQSAGKQHDGDQQRQSAADKRDGGQQSRGEKSGEPQAGESNDDASERGQQQPSQQRQDPSSDGAKRGPGDSKSADEQSDSSASKSEEPGEQQETKQGRSPEASQKPESNNQRGDMKNDAKSADKQPGDKQDTSDQQQPGDGQSDEQKPADEGQGQKQSQKGQGAKAKSDPSGNQNEPSPDAEQSDAKGGDGEQPKGEPGAGQKSTDKQGSPSPQKDLKAHDKSQSPSSDDPESKEDPNQAQSPSQNENESDSQGQDDGDRSGGGKRGGGQKANKAGTGGAGQNTAADEGAGASEQKGDGETSNRAGEDKQADGQTGKSGDQRGKGSKSQEADSKDGEQSPLGADSKKSAKGETSPDAARDGQSRPGGGTPTGGNTDSKSDDSEPAEQPYRTAPEVADEANLEFAREASDLALSHLKDELAKDQPDANLLKDLGWSRNDLQKFVSRWEHMQREAKTPGTKGETARRELDDTLKSLGLRPRATNLKENSGSDDAVRGLRESRKSSPPPEYAEQVKAYKQGTARGKK